MEQNQGFLKSILEHKKAEVESAMNEVPLAEVRALAAKRKDFRSFTDALGGRKTDNIYIIAEIKRASPSRGVFREDLMRILR